LKGRLGIELLDTSTSRRGEKGERENTGTSCGLGEGKKRQSIFGKGTSCGKGKRKGLPFILSWGREKEAGTFASGAQRKRNRGRVKKRLPSFRRGK